MKNRKYKISGLILSAGNSSRMGKDKAFLDYNGISFIKNLTLKLSSFCDNVIIVSGNNHSQIKEFVENIVHETSRKIYLINNPKSELGMFSSLQCGIRAGKDPDWILYHFIDQQNLSLTFYSSFMDQIYAGYNWIQPSFEGRKGHPILINSRLFDRILNSDVSHNLRELSASKDFIKYFWECDHKEIFEDIDTPDQYERLIELKDFKE